MNYDELAFFNHQLAAMLRDGIPLEGALRQLTLGMKTGPLRAEVAALQNDLAGGLPLKDALPRRSLPPFYLQMIQLGARSNDLPGVLTLLADYYQRANIIWNRLKGLMVYPLIVMVVSLGITVMLSIVFGRFLTTFARDLNMANSVTVASMWIAPGLIAAATILALAAISIPGWRARLRWRLPAFREASLAQLASTMSLMLKNGTTLPEALAMAESIEGNTPAGRALATWRRLVEGGYGRPDQWPPAIFPFPPMFLWLVQKGGEDLAAGFQKAADIYHARANYRIELALYGALPISILLLGQMVFWQIVPLVRVLTWIMRTLGDTNM